MKEKIATAPTARRQQKWMIIHNALVDPRSAIEIAQHTATSLRLSSAETSWLAETYAPPLSPRG